MPPFLLPEAMLRDGGVELHEAGYTALPQPSDNTSITAVMRGAAEHFDGSCCKAHQQKWRLHSWDARVVCLRGGGSTTLVALSCAHKGAERCRYWCDGRDQGFFVFSTHTIFTEVFMTRRRRTR